MEEKNLNIENGEAAQENIASPQEVRREARRRLIKAGLMSVPVIMTVHSRPLFAQTNGSVGALGYGGYNDVSPQDEVISDEDQMGDAAPTRGYDPYGDNESTFMRSRDPRSMFGDRGEGQ